MSNDINKGALLVHLDKGIVGTYVGKHKSSEVGYVYIEYVPFLKNMLSFPSKTKMKHAVAEDHIFTVNNNFIDDKGLEPTIVYIYTGEVGSSIRFINDELHQKIKKMKIQIDNLNAEVSTANDKVKKAMSGLATGIAASRDAVKQSRPEGSGNPFFNRGGFRPQGGSDDSYEEFD